MTVADAVKSLRRHEGLSQQAFGSKYKLSIATVQNYESGKMPQPRQLIVLRDAAEEAGRLDLARVLQDNLDSEFERRGLVGGFRRANAFVSGPVTEFETLAAEAFLRLLRRFKASESP